MSDVLKQSGQSSTATRASLLKLNCCLRKTNHGQNDLLYVAPNIWNQGTSTRVNTELRSIFFIE